METTPKNNARIVAIVVMFFIYAMISFVTNLAAPIGTIWGYQFEGNSVLGMMGNMMNFLAYLFMGIPAGNMLVRIGYKKQPYGRSQSALSDSLYSSFRASSGQRL